MRIVSLLPSATEIACALGLRDQLVGRSHECDHPADVGALPVLTASILDAGATPAQIDAAVSRANLAHSPIYTVDGARLAALEPDLILTQGVCAVCAVTPATVADGLELAALDVACTAPVLSLSGKDFAGVLADVQAVGQATGQATPAAALVAQLRARWAALPGIGGTPPRVFMLEWPDPPWFGGHWVPEQVAAAGGVDPFAQPGQLSGRTDWAAVAQADPDVIVACACGFGVEENLAHARALLARPEVAALRAVRAGQFWAVDSNSFFSRPAPRIVDGAELLHRLLGGRPVSPERARKVSPDMPTG